MLTLVVLITPLYAVADISTVAPTLPVTKTTSNTLIVGMENSNPPFIIQGGDNKVHGFAVNMINSLCKLMNRPCQFKFMKFEELIPAVANKQIDFAVSSITITPERLRIVNFTLPYSLSNSRFLTNATEAKMPFNLELLQGKKIGVKKGTIFVDQIKIIGIIKPVIVEYVKEETALEDLSNKNLDFMLVDNQTAVYWEANSSGALKAIGAPFSYGSGFGIAVNLQKNDLLKELNSALLLYENSGQYKHDYESYLKVF